jgi:predicted TIM-barrel fold metal-dependent hydrolase
MIGKIALEEHFGIEATLRESAEYAVPGQLNVLERRLLDLDDERLREMDAHGIAFAILSLNAPGVQSVHEPARAIDIARRGNDALAAGIARHPDRFAGFAALPLQDPEAACAELTRAVNELGFKGAMVNGYSQIGSPNNVVYYDDPMFRPVWATLASLNVQFYLHPRDPLPDRVPIRRSPVLRGVVAFAEIHYAPPDARSSTPPGLTPLSGTSARCTASHLALRSPGRVGVHPARRHGVFVEFTSPRAAISGR